MDSPATTSSTLNLECPVSIKWTISVDKLAALKDTKGGFLRTESFNASNIPGVKYFLKIYPSKYGDVVHIYLHVRRDNEDKIKIDVNYSIESAGYTEKDISENRPSLFEVCKTGELFDPEKKFIADGKFTIKCEGLIYVQREKPAEVENGIKFDIGNVGYNLWMCDDKDFTINVDGSCIKAHKCILGLQSPFFKNMFKSRINESMDINDFSVKVVETAVQFCYLGQTSNALNLKENMKLLELCNKYEINDLKTRIQASLILDVSVSNVCLLAKCSKISEAVKLEEACFKLLIKSLKTTPVADIGLLDKDFAFKVFTDAFCNITETS